MQKIIEAENSDLFDVLAYVAFAAVPMTRAVRAQAAHVAAAAECNDKQQAFVDFVLGQYVLLAVVSPRTNLAARLRFDGWAR